MRFLHDRVRLEAGATLVVDLSRAGANVMLLDDRNFELYRRGLQFSYWGEYAQGTTASIVAPGRGEWNLVVDLGGAPGVVTAQYHVTAPPKLGRRPRA